MRALDRYFLMQGSAAHDPVGMWSHVTVSAKYVANKDWRTVDLTTQPDK